MMIGFAMGSLLAASAFPPVPTLQFAFEAIVTLSDRVVPGKTARGGRGFTPITGGTFKGPQISGTIVPGGWDWQLERSDGCREIKADYMLKTDDGVIINILNQGVACVAPGPKSVVFTAPVFEAPLGRYQWLSQSTFVGTLSMPSPDEIPSGTRAVKLRFYQVK